MFGMLIALLACMWGGAQGAQAKEYKFCWGETLKSNGACVKPPLWVQAAYVQGTKAPICLYLVDSGLGEGMYGCTSKPEEGTYFSYGDGYARWTQRVIWNYSYESSKVYGIVWDGVPKPGTPSPPPDEYRYMLGVSSGGGISSWGQILGGMGNPTEMSVGDLTGDGKADIIAVEPDGSGQYRYMLGQSAGGSISNWSQILGGMSKPTEMSVGDLTGDGKADIIAVEPNGSGQYRYMLGVSSGGGISSWGQMLGGMGEPTKMALGDSTGDGKADIIAVEKE